MRGSIYKNLRNKAGGGKEAVYTIRWRVGCKQYSRVIGPNKKEAERILAETVNRINNGTFIAPQKIRFAEFARKWLSDYALGAVKESTYRAYESGIEKSINPAIGHYPIQKITTAILQSYLAEVLRAKHSAKTVNNTLTLLKTMFKHARKWGFIQVSPAEDIERWRTEEQEMDYLTPEEIQLLLKNSEEPYRTIFMTAIMTGMRRGEVLGLTWGDIDWNRNQIFVRQSLYWLTKPEMKLRGAKDRWQFVTPKSKRSRRNIVMSPNLRKALEIRRINASVSPLDLVFCNSRGNPLDPDNMVKRGFESALLRAGLRKIRFHDLRHTYCSLLIAQNANAKFIQSQLGHASIQTTFDRYGHLLPLNAEEVGTRLDSTIFGNNTPQDTSVYA